MTAANGDNISKRADLPVRDGERSGGRERPSARSTAYACSGTTYHLPACGGTCGEIEDRPAAYVRSKSGAWHVLVAEHGDRALTDCGLALKDALIDTLPPARPRVRPCESCRWPEGYPKWPVAS